MSGLAFSGYARFMVGVVGGRISLNCKSVASGEKKSTDLVSSVKNKSSSSRKKEHKRY